MSGIKTNSNSMTAILIEKLNNRKSGFRSKFLEYWKLPNDLEFIDGTHSTINLKEINDKQVDIIGNQKKETKILIEIKVNINEDLQDSQKENGEYEKVVKKYNDISLFYIIPKGYSHRNKLPKENIRVKIIEWGVIYDIAKKYDSTGLAEYIEAFVEHSFNNFNTLLDKGDVIMYFNPELIGKVGSLYSKISDMMYRFENDNTFIKGEVNRQDYSLGKYYKITMKNKVLETWIGLQSYEKYKQDCFFIWLYTSDTYSINSICHFDEKNDAYIFPIRDENNNIPRFLSCNNTESQYEEFSKLMQYNIDSILKLIK